MSTCSLHPPALHQGLLLGSVTQRAARRASFPVVVVL
ncbi:universal stress protein [Streptomyces ardesiacus]|nr:universal stress protein [Streptomyces ardesiacus]